MLIINRLTLIAPFYERFKWYRKKSWPCIVFTYNEQFFYLYLLEGRKKLTMKWSSLWMKNCIYFENRIYILILELNAELNFIWLDHFPFFMQYNLYHQRIMSINFFCNSQKITQSAESFIAVGELLFPILPTSFSYNLFFIKFWKFRQFAKTYQEEICKIQKQTYSCIQWRWL